MTDKDRSAMIVMATQVAMTVVACLLIDRAGRVVLLLTSAAGMTLCCATMGAFFYMKEVQGTQVNWLALVSLIGYIVSFSLGLGAIPWVLMGEIFPAKLRGLASSLATCLNWTMSFVLTLNFARMKAGLTTYGTFWFFAAVCFTCCVFVKAFVPETKGKSLEQIEAHFKKR
jgi:SP family facilitated glucose transporter-like MFS transporter 8